MVARLDRCSERLEALAARSRQCLLAQIAARRRNLDGCGKLLASLSYQGVLQRGYALVRDSEGRALRAAAEIAPGQVLDIELADGRIDAQALSGGGARGAEAQAHARRSPPVRGKGGQRGGGDQGSLF
jgi:exodeoxyribonuclease VII large subunit